MSPLIERIAGAGFENLMLTVDVAASANRENNIRTGFKTPLRPSLRLFWDGALRPRWSTVHLHQDAVPPRHAAFREFLRDARCPGALAHALRDFSQRDHLSWKHVELVRANGAEN